MYSRLKIRFTAGNNFNYYGVKYEMYSVLLKIIKISDPLLSKLIHENKIPRAFLFSNAIFSKKNKRMFHIYFTTPLKKVADALINSMSKISHIKLGDSVIDIGDIISEQFDPVPSIVNFLSPFVLRRKNGDALNEFDHKIFEEMIKDGIIRVSKKLDNQLHLDSYDFDVRIKGNFRKKLFTIKNTYVRAWEATSPDSVIEFNGNPLARYIAMYYGIGDKTKFGFGMLGIPKVK